MAMQASATQVAPGSQFGMPGITRQVSAKENNNLTTTVLSATTSVPATGFVPFKQSDVIKGYELQLALANTVTAGTATLTPSVFFPYNYLGAGSLDMQNQFSQLRWLSGIDLQIWQQIRPMQQTQQRDVNYQLLRGNAYNVQASLITATSYTALSAALALRFELPVSTWFDVFFPLDAAGKPLTAVGYRALVSPQYMSGTQRIVTPTLNYNQGFTGPTNPNFDQAPISNTGTQTTPPTFASTATQKFRRIGYYQPQGPSDSPPVYNWQYVRRAQFVSLAGVSSKDIPITFNGQVMSIGLRLFDPLSGAVGGASIPLANITECDLQYGPGLFRFQDTPVDMQARFAGQHYGMVPFAEGLVVWDMATDEFGRVSNQFLLNTLNTSGVQAHLDFTGAQSGQAYAVLLIEGLQWVEAA